MSLFEAMRQKPVQAGRGAVIRGEASDGVCRGEAESARHEMSNTGSALRFTAVYAAQEWD